MKFLNMKKTILKDHAEAKQAVVAGLSNSYWEMKPKAVEMHEVRESKKSSYTSVFSLFQYEPENISVPYEFGKKHNFMTGEPGKKRLIKFLLDLEKTNSTHEIIDLINQFRNDNPGTGMAKALMYALPECAKEIDDPISSSQRSNEQASLKIIGRAEYDILQEYNLASSLSM